MISKAIKIFTIKARDREGIGLHTPEGRSSPYPSSMPSTSAAGTPQNRPTSAAGTPQNRPTSAARTPQDPPQNAPRQTFTRMVFLLDDPMESEIPKGPRRVELMAKGQGVHAFTFFTHWTALEVYQALENQFQDTLEDIHTTPK